MKSTLLIVVLAIIIGALLIKAFSSLYEGNSKLDEAAYIECIVQRAANIEQLPQAEEACKSLKTFMNLPHYVYAKSKVLCWYCRSNLPSLLRCHPELQSLCRRG